MNIFKYNKLLVKNKIEGELAVNKGQKHAINRWSISYKVKMVI